MPSYPSIWQVVGLNDRKAHALYDPDATGCYPGVPFALACRAADPLDMRLEGLADSKRRPVVVSSVWGKSLMAKSGSGSPRGDDRAAQKLNEARALHGKGDLFQAAVLYESILREDPDQVDALFLLGMLRLQQRDAGGAADLFRRVLRLRPDHAEAHYRLGIMELTLGRAEQAVASLEEARRLRPGHVETHYNLGMANKALNRFAEAVDSYRRAIEIRPDLAAIHNNLGIALLMLERPEEAAESFRQVLALDPGHANALHNLGAVLADLGALEDALDSYRKALLARPDNGNARSHVAILQRQICDWSEVAETEAEYIARVRADQPGMVPFQLLAISDDPGDQLRCSRTLVEAMFPAERRDWPVPPAEYPIRLAYLSGDFHDDATSYLMAELFELHDRDRFEVIGMSYGPQREDGMRKRLRAGFDRFIEVNAMTDQEVAKLINDLGVHIAIDLKGLTNGTRLGILAARPAPIQVTYIGYPGTVGADFLDYAIVDAYVAPPDQQSFYTENLVHLPDCYQVNDGKRAISEHTPGRAECGLPEDGFVFCCFNNSYKITPQYFDAWMRLLKVVPGSVLWLLEDNAPATRNLRKEAEARGVDPSRLVFAPRMVLADHLARHRLADLFLDTSPCNAHTTASDALWVGLPVLTCPGRSFASRVAGSLLTTIGLPELIVDSLEDYEALALALATDPGRLSALRDRLAANRLTTPLFDGVRFRHHLEAAYERMFDLWKSGEAPRPFSIAAR